MHLHVKCFYLEKCLCFSAWSETVEQLKQFKIESSCDIKMLNFSKCLVYLVSMYIQNFSSTSVL